jgi:replicative DNA helicase
MDVKNSDILPQVMDYQGPDRVVSSMEFAEIVAKTPKPEVMLLSGIPKLDQATKGIIPGELTVVSGPTGMGKTLLVDTMIRSMRTDKHLSLFFTFEVTPETVALAHNTPETVLFMPLEHVAMDLDWIRWRCLEAKMKYNCEIVVIDHLHYLIDMGFKQNMSLEIGRVMRFLKKEIALGMNLAVIIICHVKQIDLEHEPSIYHLRDSSFVGQEADNVLMIWRKRDVEFGKKKKSMLQGLATLKVEKARRSGVMGLKIPLIKDGHILKEDQNAEDDD